MRTVEEEKLTLGLLASAGVHPAPIKSAEGFSERTVRRRSPMRFFFIFYFLLAWGLGFSSILGCIREA